MGGHWGPFGGAMTWDFGSKFDPPPKKKIVSLHQ